LYSSLKEIVSDRASRTTSKISMARNSLVHPSPAANRIGISQYGDTLLTPVALVLKQARDEPRCR
jgi:hypothetical protein